MSQKESGSIGCGCLVALYIAMQIIVVLVDVITQNKVFFLITFAVGGVSIVIALAYNRTMKKVETEKSESQRSKTAEKAENKKRSETAEEAENKKRSEIEKNLAIINAPETKPSLTFIPNYSYFSNKEEESINLAFREFLMCNNDVILAEGHLDFLIKKVNALRALEMYEDASLVDSEIIRAKAALSSAQSNKSGKFESKLIDAVYKVDEIRSAYTSFVAKLPNERIPLIEDFFQSPVIHGVKTSTNSALVFTPCYILFFTGLYAVSNQKVHLIKYKEASVSTEIAGDCYSDNPSYAFKNRWNVTIRCGSTVHRQYKQVFTNESFAKSFERQFKNYLDVVNGIYKNIINLLIEHSAEIEKFGSIYEYITQQSAAEKLMVATEKAEAEKKEKARKEREAALAAKRKKEQEEREAAERKKQRKENFMRNFDIIDGTLTNWYGEGSLCVLPEGLVTVIGTAFRRKSDLRTVSISNGVTTIQANAFSESSDLKRVVLPASVSSIGKEAFSGCSSLTDIVLPKAINTISSQMFEKCSSLNNIIIPFGVKKIESGAFSGCSSLTEIVVPKGVTTIEDGVFKNCVKLKKVVLPDSITEFGKNVFSGCESLEHVTLGSGIKKIPKDCFKNHKKLIDVAVASDIVEIGDQAFKNCRKLVNLIFIENDKFSMDKGMDFEKMIIGAAISNDKFALESLERIGKSAFENCFAFKGIELKDGLKTIAENAFSNCRSIKKIYLPKTIRDFGTETFAGCTSLTEVVGDENVGWQRKNSFKGSPWLTSQAKDGFIIFDDFLEVYIGKDSRVEIPENVKIIGQSAFDGNPYVSYIRIADGVTSIEELAFANCKKLQTVYIPESVSRIEDNAFSGDTDFLIQCFRGSAASAFRIRNKFPGEYIAKTKKEAKEKTAARKTRNSVDDGLSGLSEEERRMIMEMRREKLAKKKAEEEKPVVPEAIEYSLVQFDYNKVSIKLESEGRKITNNIFNLKFVQNEQAGEKSPAEYETFVVDTYGQIISDIKTICANKEGADLTHKVTYSLYAQEKFDKSAEYFVILRYKNAGLNILSKIQYQISIDFASDFDF